LAGLGGIGKKAAIIASKGFGMNVFAFDAISLSVQAEKENMLPDEFLSHYGIKEYFTDFDSFIKKVNILSIHLPVNENQILFQCRTSEQNECWNYFNKYKQRCFNR